MNTKTYTESLDVSYVANLARLALSDDEKESYGKDLAAILHYMEQLNEVNVDGIRPTAHAVPLINVMREDVSGESLGVDEMIANAPAVLDDTSIRVPAMIEDEGGA